MLSNSLLHFITNIIKFEGFKATNYHFVTENELLIQLENKSGRAIYPHCHKITDKVHQSHRQDSGISDPAGIRFAVRQIITRSVKLIRKWLRGGCGECGECGREAILFG